MSYLEKFLIELENEKEVYEPGDRVKGQLQITIKEKIKINYLYIVAKGSAYVFWKRNRTNKSFTDTYGDQEVYFDKALMPLEKHENQDVVLEAGNYSFAFYFDLPINIPTSFNAPCGRVQYWIQAVIGKQWSQDRFTHTSFSVINKHDLNLIPNLECQATDSKVFNSGFCKSKPVEISFDIQKSGFVPGETVLINIYVNNQSDRVINSIEVFLVQYVTVISKRSSYTSRDVVSTWNIPDCQVGPKTQKSFKNLTIKIPACCPSLSDTCSIIKNLYRLEVKLDRPREHFSKFVNIPILIGTVPLGRNNPLRIVSYKRRNQIDRNNDKNITTSEYPVFYSPLFPVFD